MLANETAIINAGAEIAEDVKVGAFCIIEADTQIAAGTILETGVVVKSGTRIGRNCRIHHGAVLGDAPQDIKYQGEPSYLTIGDGNVIREYATLHKASGEGASTILGDNNMLMAQTHVAHNCRIGSSVNMANLATLGGFVEVGDRAFVGGMAAVHQFCRIGTMAMAGGGSILLEDVPPYMTAAGGYRPSVVGLNTVGLLRAELPAAARAELKKAYRILYKSGLNTQQAVGELEAQNFASSEAAHLIAFLKSSQRGICAGRM